MQHIRFGNGTTALWASLRALGCHDSYIAVPSTICPSVICAIFASGNRPYFVDIERTRFGIDPNRLTEAMPYVSAVIAVHALGIPCEIAKIAVLCAEAGVPLIEDCCQSQGAEFEGSEVGQFGHVAIYSYGAGKIIDAGGGGAAICSNQALAEKLVELAEHLPELDENAVRELGVFYKFFYNQLYPVRLGEYRKIFTQLLEDIAPKLLGRYSEHLDEALETSITNLPDNIGQRRKKAELYEGLLADIADVKLLSFPKGSIPWRFNIHLDFPIRQFVLKKMLAEGRSVSSWSPDISRFMLESSYLATSLENSKWLDEGILNLWLDDTTDKNMIAMTCGRLQSLITEYQHCYAGQQPG